MKFNVLLSFTLIASMGLISTSVSGDEAKANIGIANTGDMNIEGNVTIDVNVLSRADDLVAVLEIRAGKIKKYIEEKYKERSPSFIAQFDRVHRDHINQLKAGNFVAAHELLAEIHKLSFMVELEKEKGFRVSYFCKSRRYTRGTLINAYVADDYSRGGELYPLSPKEKSVNSRGRGCGPSYIMAKPVGINTAYEKIISTH